MEAIVRWLTNRCSPPYAPPKQPGINYVEPLPTRSSVWASPASGMN